MRFDKVDDALGVVFAEIIELVEDGKHNRRQHGEAFEMVLAESALYHGGIAYQNRIVYMGRGRYRGALFPGFDGDIFPAFDT